MLLSLSSLKDLHSVPETVTNNYFLTKKVRMVTEYELYDHRVELLQMLHHDLYQDIQL